MPHKKYVRGCVHSEHGDTIQALPLHNDDDTYVTVTSTQARVSVSGMTVVRVAVSVDVFIKFGDSSVEAAANTTGSSYHPAGVEVYVVPNGTTHISTVKASAGPNGFGTITQMGDN